mgnify:CR=1 FL=1
MDTLRCPAWLIAVRPAWLKYAHPIHCPCHFCRSYTRSWERERRVPGHSGAHHTDMQRRFVCGCLTAPRGGDAATASVQGAHLHPCNPCLPPCDALVPSISACFLLNTTRSAYIPCNQSPVRARTRPWHALLRLNYSTTYMLRLCAGPGIRWQLRRQRSQQLLHVVPPQRHRQQASAGYRWGRGCLLQVNGHGQDGVHADSRQAHGCLTAYILHTLPALSAHAKRLSTCQAIPNPRRR